jgi:XTP/dITP diphosphohydrolase
MQTAGVRTILLATGNAGKVREFEQMFDVVPVRLCSLKDFPDIEEVEETGTTFAENAALKASGYARQTGLWSLADDSGLMVDALGGAPGVLSARYGGLSAGFDEKMELVLNQLRTTPGEHRAARFVCSIAVADETGKIRAEAYGECRGQIALEPHGGRGFGYDPIFVPEGFQETLGELADRTKAQISHRSKAGRKIIRYLLDFTGIPT